MPSRFSDFLDKRDRSNKDHLKIIFDLLKKSGFDIENHLKDASDAYLFVRKPDDFDSLSFNGIRIYTRGEDIIAFRAQNKGKTEPFGTAYLLDINGMFREMLEEGIKSKEIGEKLIHYITEEVFNFFKLSTEAENKISPPDGSDDKFGAVLANPQATDYANMVTAKSTF